MRIHIRPNLGHTHVRCGVSVEEIYNSLTEHLTTEAGLEYAGPHRWSLGDHACLDCVRKARPSVVKQLRACRTIQVGAWVVLCGCGGVRPYGTACGEALAAPAYAQDVTKSHYDGPRDRYGRGNR